jgi:hypothetical protein
MRIAYSFVTRPAVGLALAVVGGCMSVGSAEAASGAEGIQLAAVSFHGVCGTSSPSAAFGYSAQILLS